ncbi:MAG: ABC transporter ATP-binding protein [Polyangiaceae bacterium]|nr:ABC transporter ATP-binding protein [Polyangiaceae bacterium]
MAASVTLSGLTRRFAGAPRPAIEGLDLVVAAGETVVLVGPSGCGKSTTLRLVAGLDRPDSGTIAIGDRDVSRVPPQDRDVAMVFQGYALYPHLRVRDILAFPLKMRGVARAERRNRVAATAELLAITELLDRRPSELSGGEQQRVAMGRAIVRRPEVFLFDEPLSNLDAALRSVLRVEVGKLLSTLEATALYVTHDQTEAMTLGHRVAVLRAGRLEQIDTPRRIYEAPASTFVASFFGTPPMNLLDAARHGEKVRVGGVTVASPPTDSGRLVCGIRPEHLGLVGDDHRGSALTGTVASIELHGAESHVTVAVPGGGVRLKVAGFAPPSPGDRVRLAFPPEALHWFDATSERRL